MEMFISTQSDENQFTTIQYSDYNIENIIYIRYCCIHP